MLQTYEFIFLALALIFSAVFSGVESAFISANKLYFELQKKQGTFSGIIIAGFLQNPSRFKVTILVGNTLALVVYGIFITNILSAFIGGILPDSIQTTLLSLFIEILVATLLVLFIADFLPKAIFLLNPELFLEILAMPMWFFYYALYPIVSVIIGISKFAITHFFKIPYTEEKQIFRLEDLNEYLTHTIPEEETTSETSEINTEIFSNVLEFKNIKVRDCMINRTEIVAIEVGADIEQLRQVFLESGHSKILVIGDSIDEILGYCHCLDLFSKPTDIKSILKSIIVVPTTSLIQELLLRFITEKKSIAWVVDEFGGTAGIVSLEDIMEQIFGEIEDEYDYEDLYEEKIDNNTFMLSARHEIKTLNEKYKWNLPEGDYDTLGGLILHIHEDLPQLEDVIELPPFTFTILTIQYSRIDLVRVEIETYEST